MLAQLSVTSLPPSTAGSNSSDFHTHSSSLLKRFEALTNGRWNSEEVCNGAFFAVLFSSGRRGEIIDTRKGHRRTWKIAKFRFHHPISCRKGDVQVLFDDHDHRSVRRMRGGVKNDRERESDEFAESHNVPSCKRSDAGMRWRS